VALIEISEELQTECTELDAMCLVHGEEIARLTQSHAAEVVSLRRKIDALESALAVAEVARAARVVSLQDNPPLTSISFGATVTGAPATDLSSASAFHSSHQPAVVSVESAARRIDGTDASAVQPNPPLTDDAVRHPCPAPASSPEEPGPWDDAEASFEERMAAREFFAESTSTSEPAWRRWLLKKA